MKINLNKEQMVSIGTAGLKVGKAIIIEGTKAVFVKGLTTVVMEGLDNGTDGIKKLTLDNVIGKKKSKNDSEGKVEKKGFFKRKKGKETEVLIEVEEVVIVVEDDKTEQQKVNTEEA